MLTRAFCVTRSLADASRTHLSTIPVSFGFRSNAIAISRRCASKRGETWGESGELRIVVPCPLRLSQKPKSYRFSTSSKLSTLFHSPPCLTWGFFCPPFIQGRCGAPSADLTSCLCTEDRPVHETVRRFVSRAFSTVRIHAPSDF